VCPTPLHPPIVFEAQPTNITHFVLRHKPRNCHGDFEAQITKP
jgi:hypothetical protein